MKKQEINGIIFEQHSPVEYRAFDLNYGIRLGNLLLDEGAGWIIELVTPFLDLEQLHTLYKFMKKLPTPKN